MENPLCTGKYCQFLYQCNLKYLENLSSQMNINHARMVNIAYFRTNASSILRTHFLKYTSIMREGEILPIFVAMYHQVSWGPIFLNIPQSCETRKYCLFSYQCNIKYLEDPFSLIYINHARMANIAYFRTNITSSIYGPIFLNIPQSLENGK